jgi:hypothetical protein
VASGTIFISGMTMRHTIIQTWPSTLLSNHVPSTHNLQPITRGLYTTPSTFHPHKLSLQYQILLCSPLYSVQTGSEIRPTSHPIGTRVKCPGLKLTTHLNLAVRSRMAEIYLHSPVCRYGAVVNYFTFLNWFMHPVARESINKYRNLRTQQMLVHSLRGRNMSWKNAH